MQKRRSKSLIALLVAVIVTLLCGCSSGMSADDAKSYTQSILDAAYKGEFKDYIKWTGSTEDEAKEWYESNIETSIDQGGFNSLGLSDELLAKYKKSYKTLLSETKYEMGNVKEDDNDGYTVEINVYPFTGLDGILDETKNNLDIESLAGKSDQEINEAYYSKMQEIMDKKLESPTYGDAQTVTVQVAPDEDGVYSISESDLSQIDAAMFPADGF